MKMISDVDIYANFCKVCGVLWFGKEKESCPNCGIGLKLQELSMALKTLRHRFFLI